mgnify:CR=1 FL=1
MARWASVPPPLLPGELTLGRQQLERLAGELTEEQAVEESHRIWDTINGPNLKQNVQPTRSRATLVLRKDADHSVRYVRLRKV